MKTNLQKQAEFHEAFGHPVNEAPGFTDDLSDSEALMVQGAAKMLERLVEFSKHGVVGTSRRMLRIALLAEEVAEYMNAEVENDLVAVADGLADIEVIADGTALEHGIPLDHVREEIHRSNMSKLGADGKPIHDGRGKIMKGPNYQPPRIGDIIEAHGAGV